MPDLHEEETECCEGDECECHHCHPHEEEKENDQEIFLGDAFAGLDDKLK